MQLFTLGWKLVVTLATVVSPRDIATLTDLQRCIYFDNVLSNLSECFIVFL